MFAESASACAAAVVLVLARDLEMVAEGRTSCSAVRELRDLSYLQQDDLCPCSLAQEVAVLEAV